MSRLLLSLLTLALAGAPGAGTALAKQQPATAGGLERRATLSAAGPRLTAEPAAVTPAALPNGASSIKETYGHWVVSCQLVGGKRQCLLVHAQSDSQTGRQLFAIDLRVSREGDTRGTILMPFGLKLATGAILTIDDKEVEDGLRFSTCVPEGCLLPMSFPAVTVEAMKKSNMLTVASIALGNDEIVVFKVSLEGFAAAFSRVSELSR